MVAAATSTKKSEVLTDAVLARVNGNAKKQTNAAPDAFAQIKTNIFWQAMFNSELSATEKKEAVAKALTVTGTKEENRERVRQFEEFKEYMQTNRSELAEQIIRLTDTEAFSELKLIYDQINGALVDFDNKMAPLTDIIEAVYTLRMAGEGTALNAFKEIQEDRKREKDVENKRNGFQAQATDITNTIGDLEREITVQAQKKSFFGLGGIKPEAQARINAAKALIEEKNAALNNVRNDIVTLNAENEAIANRVGEYDKEKAKLRELLDISTDEHRQRQEDLVKAALTFVDTAKERIGAVREHLGKMNSQVENLGNVNSNMTQIYAILNEGIKDAAVNNHGIREELAKPLADETDLISKLAREEKLTNVDAHIKLLDSSATDTMMSYADLTSQTVRINAMKESNEDQINNARAMHTQGVAGVADRLSVVLQAVSSAAINESSSMARETLSIMSDNTNRIAQKEVIRVASGMSEQNKEIEKAITSLSEYGEVRKVASDITRTSLAEMREGLARMEGTARDVQSTIREGLAVHSETSGTGAAAPAATKTEAGLFSDFNK